MPGARPERGRLFTAADRNVILITHKLWVRRFGSDPDIVGKPIVFDGQPFTICGVLPESYRFALPPGGPGPEIREIDAHMPEFLEPQARGTDKDIVSVVAKLRPG